MATKTLAELNDKERDFIDCLFQNGGCLYKAAEAAGYHPAYATALRKRLAPAIIEAAQENLAINALKASMKLTDAISEQMPNTAQLDAAKSVLDRVGVIKKEPQTTTQIQNIFLIPEKQWNRVESVEQEQSPSVLELIPKITGPSSP